MDGLALHAPDATVWVAVVAAVSSTVASVFAYLTKRDTRTGNGHTIGQGVSSIEDRMQRHEDRLDRIEVRVVEDLNEVIDRLAKAAEHRNAIAASVKDAVFEVERHTAAYRHDRRLVDE